MATNEAEFKSEFREDLEHEYPRAHIWTSTDLFSVGLPDFYILNSSVFIPVEAKFIKTLPKKKTAKVLKHTVTAKQQEFLRKAQQAGSPALVIIGTSDTAVVMEDIKENYTLEELLKGKRIEKVAGKWQVKGFLDVWKK